MSPLAIYAIGVLVTMFVLNLTAVKSVKSVWIIGWALVFPLTWIIMAVVYVWMAADPEYADYVRQARQEHERKNNGR